METTTTHAVGGPARHEPSGRPSSSGPAAATWVAGTGAFLLLAAAAVFVAVSWDRLPEMAKLSLVGAVTGACIAGGRALRRTLPNTGDVLFHLGALLLPIDLAGLGLRANVGWRAILLSEGILGVTVLGGLAAASGSVVLAWAATASMVALAAGIAAVCPVPAAVALAVAAGAASLLGRRREALAWSLVAALGPVLGFAVGAALEGTGWGAGVLSELGVDGGLLSLAGCLAAAVVLGREAKARDSLVLAGLAVGGAVNSAVATWSTAGVSDRATVMALPAVFLAVEVTAALCDRDPFWRHPARFSAAAAEAATVAVGGLWTAGLIVAAPFVDQGFDLFSDDPGWTAEPTHAASFAVLALGWAVAGLRRRPTAASLEMTASAAARFPFPIVWCALAAVVAVEVGTASAVATAVALVAAGGALLWTGAPLALLAGAGFALWAPVAVYDRPGYALAAGTGSAVVLAAAAVVAAGAWRLWTTRALTVAAVAAGGAGAVFSASMLDSAPAHTLGLVLAWLVAAAVGRADAPSGAAVRLGMAFAAASALAMTPADGVLPIAVTAALLTVDAVRLRDEWTGLAAAAAVQPVVVVLSRLADFSGPETGVVLALSSVVWAGLAALFDDDWRLPFVAAAGMGLGLGLVLASGDPRLLSDTFVIGGGLLVGAGLATRQPSLAHFGGVAATLGIVGHLNTTDITALEPFVTPVAGHLLAAGWLARRSGRLSSWTAYGPAVALLGGAALAERLAGGPAWHSLVAGAVGVAAVAAGGWRRLAGPLFLGTGLLVSVTAVECLGALAGVPTWAWLALGGSVLLGTGIALERADTSPAEAGRRLVDVIAERFE